MGEREQKEKLTPKRAREVLRYDPKSGLFWWRQSLSRIGKAGHIAGGVHKTSRRSTPYWSIRIDGKQYPAHRLAWLIVHGEWPAEQIDHINGNGLDNRIANLREATNAQNQQNKLRASNNRSGFKGVRFHTQTGKYRAQITRNGKTAHLGLFDCPKEAHKAYCEAADDLHGEFANHGGQQ